MASITITVGPLTSTFTLTNAKAQEVIELALPEFGYPPPSVDADGNPTGFVDSNQARLDWVRDELVDYLRSAAKRAKRRQLELDNRAAIDTALAALDTSG